MARLLVLLITLAIWIMLNYYIGVHGLQVWGDLFKGNLLLYWTVLFLLALSYLLGKIGERIYPGRLSRFMTVIGSYWLAFFFYAFLMLVFIDILHMVDGWLNFLPAFVKEANFYTGTAVLLFLLALVVYGSFNARNPVIRQYNITIARPAKNVERLHIIMVSDLHLGSIVNDRRLMELVETINKVKPDLVFLVGDIIDENVKVFKRLGMKKILEKLKPKIGAYAVLGNHDYYGGEYKEVIKSLEEAGIKVLRDQYELVADSFYLVGRDDKFSRSRQSLAVLLQDIDQSFPVIVLDHNPIDIEEARANQVDLQLSGHTHKGQLAPLNRITRRLFATDWGYLKIDNLQVIVSNGFGTWGPPVRIGNRPEIVEIFLQFDKV
ncbi:hypothetical protein SAMN02745221_01472 [Thermosyntropha lipolytica DSM 11003]|uniref:Calcineurin-like phosphoesterase domain-containing protein n=1 Tax=Thermosyntropha lipolytica DSM 11003 TaxID=1123382 RepID=A0A1M5PHQ5_9FIRM|nr:metallophosphoesterase [Thermosyntropha lipolytica]SHH01285.1 hypothetical protein SAMN02745221_01472 [Thermosyntropha lipolytica DSM 11003]